MRLSVRDDGVGRRQASILVRPPLRLTADSQSDRAAWGRLGRVLRWHAVSRVMLARSRANLNGRHPAGPLLSPHIPAINLSMHQYWCSYGNAEDSVWHPAIDQHDETAAAVLANLIEVDSCAGPDRLHSLGSARRQSVRAHSG